LQRNYHNNCGRRVSDQSKIKIITDEYVSITKTIELNKISSDFVWKQTNKIVS